MKAQNRKFARGLYASTLVILGSTSGGCGSKGHAPLNPVTPPGNPGGVSDASFAVAPAEPGFANSDLVQKYCTIDSAIGLLDSAKDTAPAGGPYLLSNLNNSSGVTTVLFQKPDGSYAADAVLGQNNIKDSSCDLTKLSASVAVNLATLKVYATSDLKGDAACVYAPGELPEYPQGVAASGAAWSLRLSDMATKCGGLTQGYTNAQPNIVVLYAKP